MSRLIDELNRIGRVSAQPMGFRTERTASSASRILLITSLDSGAAGALSDYINDANAVLLRLAKSRLAATTIQKIVESLPDIPWGGFLEDTGSKKVATLVEAGCDFVVLPTDSPVTATPQDEKVGKVLQVESSLDDSSLRAINELAVDAVLTTEIYAAANSMAWHHVIKIQRMASLLTKPLIVPVSLNITDSELKAIWEAGADGVVVEADAGKPEGLKELRQIIGKLPPRSARKRGKAEALLPYPSGAKETEPQEEEEEE